MMFVLLTFVLTELLIIKCRKHRYQRKPGEKQCGEIFKLNVSIVNEATNVHHCFSSVILFSAFKNISTLFPNCNVEFK